MSLYITMYDLINKYNDSTCSITRSIPITYFYNEEELKINIYKECMRAICDFIGDGLYGLGEDYNEIALFVYDFDDKREFNGFTRIISIGYKALDIHTVYIEISKTDLINYTLGYEEFKKCLNMEIKMSNNINHIIRDIEFIIE